jgi:F0F1-type ATP synthase membrane subunit b/b'
MILMQAAADTSMGGSIINERVQIEIEALLDDYEEKKIAHERLRREEIKRMQDETKGEKGKIKEAAMKEVENIKKTLHQSSLKDRDTRVSTRKA